MSSMNKKDYECYRRSANMLFYTAVYDVLGPKAVNHIAICHSVGNAWFYDYMWQERPLSDEVAADIQAQMEKLVEAKLPFYKETMKTEAAIDYFKEIGREDKVNLLKYRRATRTNLTTIHGYKDYFYGTTVENTGKIDRFRVQTKDHYLLLILPRFNDQDVVPEFNPQPKLLNELERTKEWYKLLGISNVGELNNLITSGDYLNLILVQEALQSNLLNKIAGEIVEKKKKIILIAGPSSSGKTTTSNRLAIQLQTYGLKPHPIAMDDFFLERSKTPKLPNGEYDFESVNCMDVELFTNCMLGLLRGEEVYMPRFNFLTGESERQDKPMKIGEQDVLIIEGIHGLNDKLTGALPDDAKYRIYVSALTQLSIDNQNRIPTTDVRLLRRIVRDARVRGYDARDTISRWQSVRDGEEKNIFPFQECADVMFNSAQVYELAVMKQYAEPLLFAVPRDCPEYDEAKRLLKFLDYFLNISDKDIPIHSIIREFVGGGCFRV